MKSVTDAVRELCDIYDAMQSGTLPIPEVRT